MVEDLNLAKVLIEAFDNDETGILLWDKKDNLCFANEPMFTRFNQQKVNYEIGQNFYDRMKLFKKNKVLTDERVQDRIKNFEKAKKSKTPYQFVVKGPTGRWIQIRDSLTPSGYILTVMSNVTEIIEQDLERKRLAEAIENFPSGVMFWDENDELIIANKKTEQLHKQWGVNFKLKKGTKFQEMLEKQISSNLYEIPNNTSKEE